MNKVLGRISAYVQSQLTTRFVQKDEGATAVEYGLIIALIAVAIITAVGFLSGAIQTAFNAAGNALNGTTTP